MPGRHRVIDLGLRYRSEEPYDPTTVIRLRVGALATQPLSLDVLGVAKRASARTVVIITRRAASVVANVPAAIASSRAHLAELRGDAERAIELDWQALAELGEGEWMLDYHVQAHLGVAEWLRGRVPEAERGLSSIIAHWRAAGERAWPP
jgi:hypothetical protein